MATMAMAKIRSDTFGLFDSIHSFYSDDSFFPLFVKKEEIIIFEGIFKRFTVPSLIKLSLSAAYKN